MSLFLLFWWWIRRFLFRIFSICASFRGQWVRGVLSIFILIIRLFLIHPLKCFGRIWVKFCGFWSFWRICVRFFLIRLCCWRVIGGSRIWCIFIWFRRWISQLVFVIKRFSTIFWSRRPRCFLSYLTFVSRRGIFSCFRRRIIWLRGW